LSTAGPCRLPLDRRSRGIAKTRPLASGRRQRGGNRWRKAGLSFSYSGRWPALRPSDEPWETTCVDADADTDTFEAAFYSSAIPGRATGADRTSSGVRAHRRKHNCLGREPTVTQHGIPSYSAA